MAKSATFLCYGDIINNEEKQQASIFGDIEMPGISSKQFIDFIENNKAADELVIRINSRGGSVQEGFLIFDLLKNSGKKITTIGEGKIYSIATVIFLAGDKRIMFENADGLIHMPFIPPYTLADSYDSKELERLSNDLKMEEEKILQFYTDKTGYEKEKLRDFMSQETMLSAQDMLDLGFATEIQQPLKAVAYFNLTNKNEKEMTEKEDKKLEGLLSKFEKFVNSFSRLSIKNMELKDVNGTPFTVVREEGEIQVGDEASPDGEFVIEDGTSIVIEGGVITAINAPAEENEEVEALKAENEGLKQKISEMEASQNQMNEELKAFRAQKTEVETLVKDLKNFRSTVVIEGRQQNFKSTEKTKAVDIAKVEENLKKLKEGK